jgi:hypothetical protein
VPSIVMDSEPQMSITAGGRPQGWEQVAMAIDKVRSRLQRAASALDRAGIPYAVLGGNAVAEWVGRVDQAAVRFTQDVDILIRRSDLPKTIQAMQNGGFVYRRTLEVDLFLDGPDAGPRDAVHLVFAGEKVREHDLFPAAEVDESERAAQFSVLSLTALVRMKLTSFRDKDRTHLRDMLGVGLIDPSWCARFPAPLAQRLQQLIDSPDG